MSLFDETLMNDETLFKDDTVLDFDFLPSKILYREDLINNIVLGIKPLFFNQKPNNFFIFGVPGIGKTASVRFVLKELEEKTDNIKPLFINCWRNTTKHSIFVEIARQINLPFPDKGISTETIIQTVFTKLKNKKGVVIVFDEIDKSSNQDFLYEFIENLGRKVSVILITNNKEFILSIDDRIKSRLCLETIEFKPYSFDEVTGILKERVKYAFKPSVVEEEVIKLISEQAFNKKDVRLGLFLLLKSGKIAERDASKKVLEKHYEKAINLLAEFRIKISNKELTKTQEKIFQLIKQNPGNITGFYYNAFLKDGGGLTPRAFRNQLQTLEKEYLIKFEETGKGFRGRSRKIFPLT